MKAEIVRNAWGTERVLLTFESDEERRLFAGGPVLLPCVESHTRGEGEEPMLNSWSFELDRPKKRKERR